MKRVAIVCIFLSFLTPSLGWGHCAGFLESNRWQSVGTKGSDRLVVVGREEIIRFLSTVDLSESGVSKLILRVGFGVFSTGGLGAWASIIEPGLLLPSLSAIGAGATGLFLSELAIGETKEYLRTVMRAAYEGWYFENTTLAQELQSKDGHTYQIILGTTSLPRPTFYGERSKLQK